MKRHEARVDDGMGRQNIASNNEIEIQQNGEE